MLTDYDSIVDFRRNLDTAIQNLNDSIKGTEGAVEEVSEVWKDKIFTDFQNKFGEDKELLVFLNKELEEFNEVVLYRVEENVKTYLENRF